MLSLTLNLCVDTGVDLSCIVQAAPAVSFDGKQEEQTHEVLQVSLDLICEKGLLTINISHSHSSLFHLQALDSLRIGKDSAGATEVMEDIKRFTEHCSLGFAQRYLAAQKDAYPVILSYCKKSVEDQEAVLTTLSALAALTDGQPDLLDAEGQQFLLHVLRKYQADTSVTRVAICVVRRCCLKHEQNRQDLVKGGILPLLTGAIRQHSACAELVKEASAALRVMTFDDDVRVTFGQAHEHAKSIVLEHNGLKILIEAAKGKAS